MTNLIISKTPYRVSFVGGSTDYPDWYRENGGAVLSTTIDKYCTLLVRKFPPFFEHKYMLSYSELERTNHISEIKHPSIRECIKYLNISDGLDIYHAGDLPARTGMGTSSSFTVGLLKALCHLKGEETSNYVLGLEAIKVEQEIIKENVGSQDQMAAAVGGFNHITFGTNIYVDPVVSDNIPKLESSLMLFFTGFARTATEVAKEQISNIRYNSDVLKEMHSLVEAAKSAILTGDLKHFGGLLGYSWNLKKKLSSKISTEYIDFLYDKAIYSGALGGKLLGAGSGGFLLFVVDEDHKDSVKLSLSNLMHVPFKFETQGSQIIYPVEKK
jgi:D-glycero-alpha-D-manno-heptose-7-phosphate kinase